MKKNYQKVLWTIAAIGFLIASLYYFQQGSSLAWANLVAGIVSAINVLISDNKPKK